MTSVLIPPVPHQIGKLDLPALEAFYNRNGEAHLLFACHAALPLGLTPELLYSLWNNFKVDGDGESLNIPWVATPDLLLSNLCEEVGAGLYEMDRQIRITLLNLLEQDTHFELKRIRELAAFLATYVQPQLKSENLDIRDFSQAQNWVAMAYLRPEKAAQELANALADIFHQQPDDLLRIASIVGALEKPLADYPDLLTYARGMAKYAQGEIEAAQKEFEKIQKSDNLFKLSSKGLPIPRSNRKQVEIKRQQNRENLPLRSQLLLSLAVGVLTSSTFWAIQTRLPNNTLLIEPVHSSKLESVIEAASPESISDALKSNEIEAVIVQPSDVTDQKPSPEKPFISENILDLRNTTKMEESIEQTLLSPEVSSDSDENISESTPDVSELTEIEDANNQTPLTEMESSPNLEDSTITETSLNPIPVSTVETVDTGIGSESDQENIVVFSEQDGEAINSQPLPEGLDSEATPSIATPFSGLQDIERLPSEAPTEPDSPAILPPLEDILEPDIITITNFSNPAVLSSNQEALNIERYEFIGNTVFSDSELETVTRPFTTPGSNRPITYNEVAEASAAITQLYLNNDYATSRALVPSQPFRSDSVATIQIIEGTVESIVIVGLEQLDENYVRRHIEPGLEPPLNIAQVLYQLQKLQQDPRIDSFQATLQSGEAGRSILLIRIKESN